ncbi:hypothetical protein QI003_23965 [Bacillus stercoris]|uniref:hypothetical protein n=1 Tax=Bacillus TaxID=1386 RepID=UPI00249B1EA9|nr:MULTISPECIES: hypothetical protein [Bacillus]MDN0191575.1 hypothetical protein [Bacillus sp. B.PNR1]MDN3032481.1 hypothetical protein [Bacillus sp. B.PNR2]WGV95498.1 hypothetical protein QI003_23965 [Bacillus stercoris]
MAIGFTLGAINVNSQQTNTAIAIGENQLPGWAAHRKVNNGIGFFAGNVLNQGNVSTVIDPDGMDGVMNNQNISPSVQNQTL